MELTAVPTMVDHTLPYAVQLHSGEDSGPITENHVVGSAVCVTAVGTRVLVQDVAHGSWFSERLISSDFNTTKGVGCQLLS